MCVYVLRVQVCLYVCIYMCVCVYESMYMYMYVHACETKLLSHVLTLQCHNSIVVVSYLVALLYK